MEHYYAYVYVRILQALGAYGFRGFYERKAHFLQSVPYALKNLRWLAANVKLPIALPALMEALDAIGNSEKLQGLTTPEATGLTVRIFSFSFHNSAPVDELATAAALSSMRARFPIRGEKCGSVRSPARTTPSSTT